ncbi:geranylgeranylglyceryl/heptaprenylglyceryl phosphate synthase [Haladaptatus pallidirubidus]|uniref:phosphoglycerol geranylgeranyltransferase n=1 Tax=Haladaptatus pallidirubidus TaxID=1008152 RepID=A0AAV3UNG8_9EURY|nr:geranylgeranylglyceryl/heptaprenylglyceryl phosphate synthase [Haladaptatus pallidirubidus]
MATWAQWNHVTKVDPDKALHDEDTYAGIADTGTVAIIVEGTTNATEARVQPIIDALSSAQLFYEGGIHDYNSAYEMANVADTIVVGDMLHVAGIEAVEATVRGTTDAKYDSKSCALQSTW